MAKEHDVAPGEPGSKDPGQARFGQSSLRTLHHLDQPLATSWLCWGTPT